MKHNFSDILPFLLIADLILPFLLAPVYRDYSHLTQVMSVLGNAKAPLHVVYNIWLVVLGVAIALSALQLYPAVADVSGVLAVLFCSALILYAVGGCILSGIFPVGETKTLETMSAKIHGYGSVLGFLLLTFEPLLIALYFYKTSSDIWGTLSLLCFVLAVAFFVLFVMADKPIYKGTVVAWEGLWQRLSLLCMYLPIMALCILENKS